MWRVVVAGILLCVSATLAQRPADFGQQWVRSYPFQIMGVQQWPQTFDVPDYKAANMTSTLVWWADGNGKQTAAMSSAANLPWHAMIVDGEGPEEERIRDYASVGNAAGWMIGDEIARTQMPWYGDLLAWTKQNRPNDLAYTNAFPTYASPDQLYGGPPPGGTYTYSQYLEDIVQVMKPDVLMYDHYPFAVNNGQRHDYFDNMMQVRAKAREHNLPYWAFMQSMQWDWYRQPSSSDLRMQVFSHMTAGYTGISYFTFDHIGQMAMLDPAGNPTPIHAAAAELNVEAKNLGNALRFMKSDGVYFMPNTRVVNGMTVTNETPLGLTNWHNATDPDPHLFSISFATRGLGRDALLGFFTDDNGDDCFMITNLRHGETLSGGAASQTISLFFDTSVNEILRLDPLTGTQELLQLTNHRLNVTLPGGSAALFKYNEGSFIVPEPGSAVLAIAGVIACAVRRRRRGRIAT